MGDDETCDISEEDIKEVVANKLGNTNFKIEHFKLEPLPQRIGLLGDHSFLKVSILPDNNVQKVLSFFVKYFPKMPAPAEFAEGIGAFKKEAFIYELIAKFRKSGISNIDKCSAGCYLVRDKQYLILDDVISEGFQPLDKRKTLNYNQVVTVLNSLAQLHASTFVYEEKKSSELGREYRLIEEYEENLEESFFNDKIGFINEKGIEASIKCVVKETSIFNFPEKLPSGKKFADVVHELCYKIYELVKPSKKFRNVICHGDLWATNFLLKDDNDGFPNRCKFVDFQCGRYVPPAHDVLTFLYLTTSKNFQEKYLYQLVGTYYTFLEKQLKSAGLTIETILPFEEFLSSCEEQKIFAIVETAIYFPLILISNDEISKYFSDRELNEKALFEDRSFLVLAHMDKDECYKNRLIESIENLREYCNHL